jgi:serine/threonine-protein kinase
VVAAIAFDPFGWNKPAAGGSPSAARSATSTARTGSGATTQPTPTATLPAGVTQCSPKVGVGTKNTSCQLAANVAADIPDDPGDQFTVDAYSPVTGKTYTLTCTSGQYYRCVKEKNNIEVYVIK